MREIPIHEYIETHGQTATGRKLGLTQGAIWQMLKSPRQIFVIENTDGEIVGAYEKKPVGKTAA